VLSSRAVTSIESPNGPVPVLRLDRDDAAADRSCVVTEGRRVPLAPFLAQSDIVVNCTLQDPNAPVTYLRTDDLDAFRPGSLIVDVSCDEGMGFSWACPTSFADPMFEVGDHIRYCAVDHSPSYLWDSATWEVSEALLPFIDTVLAGPAAWDEDETISRVIEIPRRPHRQPAPLPLPPRVARLHGSGLLHRQLPACRGGTRPSSRRVSGPMSAFDVGCTRPLTVQR